MNRAAKTLLLASAALLVACGGSKGPTGPNKPDLGSFIGPSEGPGAPDGAVPKDMGMVDPASADCSTPIAVMNGTTLSGQDTSGSSATLSDLCVYGGDGSVLFYSASVPAGQKITVTVTPTDGSFDPVVRVFDTCGATVCDTFADSGVSGDAETAIWANTGAASHDVIIAVGGYDAGGGTFDLSVQMVALPANASCTGAKPITTAAPLSGEDGSGAGGPITACLDYSTGGVLYYSTTLPARTAMTATATPTGSVSWDPSLRVLDACGATSCLGSSDSGYSDEPEVLTYKNKSASPQPVLIAVGSGGTAGTFDLSLTEAALPPPPTNTTCATATALADGTTLTQDNSEGVDVLTSDCEPSGTGAVLYYKATVPANHRLDVNVLGSSGVDPVLRVLSGCAATTCLTSADLTASGETETVTYKNTTASSVTVIVAVGSYSDTSAGSFDLDAHIVVLPAPPTNLTCATATSVTSGSALMSQDQAAATVAENALCVPGGTGDVLFYKATIPSGQTLIARAAPQGSWDPVVRLLSSCSASSCLASQDAGASGAAEVLSYKNTSGASMPVVFTVGSYSSTSVGAFDLTTTIKGPPTNLTCAAALAVSSGTSLPGEDGAAATGGLTSACLPSATGNVLYYKITIPGSKSLKVDVAPTGFDAVIRVISACGVASCLGSVDAGGMGTAESLTYANPGSSPMAVIFAVGGYGASGTFDLAVSIL